MVFLKPCDDQTHISNLRWVFNAAYFFVNEARPPQSSGVSIS